MVDIGSSELETYFYTGMDIAKSCPYCHSVSIPRLEHLEDSLGLEFRQGDVEALLSQRILKVWTPKILMPLLIESDTNGLGSCRELKF